MSLGRDFWLKIVFLFFKLEFDGRGDPNFALGGMPKRSKGCSFWSSGGRSPLRPPDEILSPPPPQTIILVLGHPPITIPGLGTIPGTPGALERAGGSSKSWKGWFSSKILDLGRIWSNLEGFEGMLRIFIRFWLISDEKSFRSALGRSETLCNIIVGLVPARGRRREVLGPWKRDFRGVSIDFPSFPSFSRWGYLTKRCTTVVHVGQLAKLGRRYQGFVT